MRAPRVSILLLLSGCAAAEPRWLPPSPSDPQGRCSVTHSCDGDDEECLREARDAGLHCALDRVAQSSGGLSASQRFDALAAVALSDAVRCGERWSGTARGELRRRLEGELPAVMRDVLAAERRGQVDLAARRAELVLQVFRNFDGPLPEDVYDVELRTRSFHKREAERLAETRPITAAYHACGVWGERCPRPAGGSGPLTPELERLSEAEGGALGLKVIASGLPECAEVLSRMPQPRPSRHALTSTTLFVSLDRCTRLPSIETPAVFACGAQTATGTRVRERYEVRGRLAVDGEERAFGHVFEQERAVGALRGCNVATPPFATAEQMALFQIRDQPWSLLLRSATSEPLTGSAVDVLDPVRQGERLAAVAAQAARDGQTDKADEVWALLLDERFRRGHRAAAEQWFADRFGAPTNADAPRSDAPYGVSSSALGFVIDRYTVPPSCH